MPRRYVLLLAQSVLLVALIASRGAGVPDWVDIAAIVLSVAMIAGYFAAVRDVIANPRLELEQKVAWVVGVFLLFPIAVPLYVFRHGLPWRKDRSEPRRTRAPIWPPSSSG